MSIFEGILGYYKLEDPDGGDRVDFFDIAPNLVEQGTPKKIAGIVGSGVGCGGYGGSSGTAYLADDVSNSAFFDIQGVDRTYVGWFNAASFANDPGIISNWANPGGGVQWLLFTTGGNLQFQIRDIGAVTDHAVTLPIPSLNTWNFFAVWYDSFTGEIGLRLNKNHSASGNTPSVATVTSRFAIGSRNGGTAVLNGGADAIGIYNRVLGSGELNQLYNNGSGLEPPFDDGPAYIGGFMYSEGIHGPSGVIGGYMFAKVPTGNNNGGMIGGFLLSEPGTTVGPKVMGGYMLAGNIRLDGPDVIGGFLDAKREIEGLIGGYIFGVPNYVEEVNARARTLVAVTSDEVPGQKLNMEAVVVFKGVSQSDFHGALINANTFQSDVNAKVEVEKFKRPPSVFITSVTPEATTPIFDASGTRKVCVMASGDLGDGNQFVSAHIDFGDPFDIRGGFKPYLSISGFQGPPPWFACHDYNISGNYSITARCQDDLGMVGMAVSGLNLASGTIPGFHYPIISISGDPRFGEVPRSLEVEFSVLSSGINNPPYTAKQSSAAAIRSPTDERILWNFGNRERSTRSNPRTYYQSPGFFAPTLRFLYTNPSGYGRFMISDTLLLGWSY